MLSGAVPDLNTKYSSDERSKFDAIITANRAKDTETVKKLMAQLSQKEQPRFKEYFADLAKVQQHIKALEASAELRKASGDAHMQNVASIESQMAGLDVKKAVIFTQGSQQAVSDMKSRPLNGQSTTTSNTRIVNKI